MGLYSDPMPALVLVCMVACMAPCVLGISLPVAPCSACRAIAQELQDRLDNEPTRNHLDMRHRLDAGGQRYGKVIDYKVSELRAIELLDDLCSRMKQWTLVTVNSTDGIKTWHWEPTAQAASGSRPPPEEEEVRQKQLTAFCGRVLEEHDEDITEAIQQGKLDNEGAVKWLCHGLLGTCPVGRSQSRHRASTEVSVSESEEGVRSVDNELAELAAKEQADREVLENKDEL